MPEEKAIGPDEAYAHVVGAMIAALREEKGLLQTALADKAGIAQSTLSRIERGESLPDTVTLRRVADALGITFPDLTAKAEQAVSQAEQVTKKVVPQAKQRPWWEAASGMGAAGFAALVTLAVAAFMESGRKR